MIDLTKLYPGQLTTEQYIERARARWGDRYDYSQTVYVNYRTKVIIICREHGPWSSWPSNHTRAAANGCPVCANESRTRKMTGRKGTSRPHTREQFIERAQRIHGDRYDYSQVDYRNASTRVEIICRVHGPWMSWPQNHLHGYNCPACAAEQSKTHTLSTDEFIERAQRIHGDRYDYSQVAYVNMHTLVVIVCPDHGPWEQMPRNHVRGSGCPVCGRLRITGRPKKGKS